MNDHKLHQQILAAEAKSLTPPKELEYCDDCNRDIDDCKCPLCPSCQMKIEANDVDAECDCEESDKRRQQRLKFDFYKRDKEDA